jgi:hypothetical protein
VRPRVADGAAPVVDPFTGAPLRASHQQKPLVIGPCDPTRNGRRGRPAASDEPAKPTTPFDPIAGLLAAARQENS